MLERRSLKLPIALGVTMIVLIVLLIVGWVAIALLGTIPERSVASVIYWTLIPTGIVLLTVMLLGVVMYLSLSIKAINLSRRQANFIDSVTHELKSPLASLKLYLQTLKRPDIPADRRESFRRIMLDDVERLDQLIDHLLDAGRLERQEVGSDEPQETELAGLLEDCVAAETLRYRVDPSVVTLNLEPCLVSAARTDLHILFRNLVDNALKYAGVPPQVEVQLRLENGNQAVIRIQDNGRGIPARERRQIFDRFVRLGLELERQQMGTGLGLYIVRNVINRIGGAIRIREPQEGSGSVFEVTLPARKIETTQDALQPLPPAPA